MREISLPLLRSTVGKVSARLQVASRGLWRLIKEKPLGAFGGVIVLSLLLCALLAPWIATNPYDQTNVRNRLKPPSSQFYFGTDNLGRDLFSRIVYGARVSVTVGFGAVSIGICLATMIGVGSGYFGGKADVLVQRLVDAQMAIPGLLLLLNIMAVLGPGLLNTIVALGIVSAAGSSRIIRRRCPVGQGKSVCGGGTSDWCEPSAHHPPLYPAEYHGADHHHYHGQPWLYHPHRVGLEFSRLRRAPAVSLVGRDVEWLGALVHAQSALDGHLAGRGHQLSGVRVQCAGRCVTGSARPTVAGGGTTGAALGASVARG